MEPTAVARETLFRSGSPMKGLSRSFGTKPWIMALMKQPRTRAPPDLGKKRSAVVAASP